MSDTVRVPGHAALRNRGVPVSVHRLATDEAGDLVRPYVRIMDGDGEDAGFVYDEMWIKLTNASLADLIEDDGVGWSSAEEWEKALNTHPFRTIARSIAIITGMWVDGVSGPTDGPVPDVRRAALTLRDDDMDAYATALGAAYAMANGIETDAAGKLIRAGVRTGAKMKEAVAKAGWESLLSSEEELDAEIDKFIGEITPTVPSAPDSGGALPLPSGSVSVEVSTSSGD
jgi:hypothetical protein